MIRLGLVGCGRWGWRYIPAAREAGCRVTHVSRVGSTFPPEARASLDGVVVSPFDTPWLSEVDAVIVATGPEKRAEVLADCLRLGLPAMVEKPLAMTFAEAFEIASKFEARGLPFLVNHQHLFSPAYEELRERVLDAKSIFVNSCGEGPGPVRSYSALWDYGPHDIAMILGIIPAARVKNAYFAKQKYNILLQGVSESQSGFVRVSNAAPVKQRTFSVLANDRLYLYNDQEIDGKKLRADTIERRNGEQSRVRSIEYIDVSPERPLTRAVRAFEDAVMGFPLDWRFGSFGADVVTILEGAEKFDPREVREGGRAW